MYGIESKLRKERIKILLMLAALFVMSYALANRSGEVYEGFSINHTMMLKGFSILTVVFCHMGKQLRIEGIQFIAGVGVSFFLILSGYGLAVSYKKSGLNIFWRKKISRIILPFYVISIVSSYLAEILDRPLLIKILTFRSMWYMWYLMIWYIIFYAIMKCKEKMKLTDHQVIRLHIIAAILWLVLDSLFFTVTGAEALHARQMPSFVIGVSMALSEKIRKRVEETEVWRIVGLSIVGVLFLALTQLHAIKSLHLLIGNAFSLLTVVPLALCVIKSSLSWKMLWNNDFC